ncbi:rab11 family-interacting protein 1-like [Oncorhynchus tshawytscha]|uniref:Rab11 family-interacting protein 5 n=1 Tax=Oncorhynchus tshawytscha TaxID=74940 RepID=A0A8C8HJU4_ONCTS|nr:rab11 family-interacting protein 1-like [Oncorhynchus tshawytscha]
MMSFIDLNDDQRWVPTHVNVTVLRARGLRTKGKHGGSRYVYTIIQVGKEKYTTGLVEKATVPEWNEECCFELLPGILEDGVRSAFPSGSGDLVLTIMHRVLIGLDVFLGQAILPLDKIFQDGMCPRDEWLKLNSKAGRKEKERGEIQVTVQFTRNNLTASMFDLTMKDKPRSAFGKLKDRVTGRKIGDMESSSAIVPGRFAALSGSLGKPFREGERGEGGEDPVEIAEEKQSKVKDFFKGKGKLRSSSDTRSCLSLASESSMLSLTSERPCPPPLDLGILVDPSSPPSSPIYSNKVKVDTHHRDTDLAKKVLNNTQSSPKILTHNRSLSDEASRITTTAVPQPCPAVESLKGQGITPSQSPLCINGSHIYGSEPVGPKGSGTLPSKLVLLEKCSPLSCSLQNLTKQSEDNGSAGEGRRWSFDKVNKEDEYVEKEAEPHVSQVQSAQVGGRPVLAAASMLSSTTTVDSADKRKKLRKSLFSGGKSDSLPAKLAPSQGCPLTEGRLRSWFGSSDSQNKPRLEVSSKVESDSDTPPPLPPRSPIPTQCSSSTGRASPDSGHPTNTFTPSLTPNPISPANPFLPCLQCNPFFEDLITEEARRSPPCATCSPCHSTALPCIPSTAHDVAVPKKMATIRRERPRPVARQTSLPALLPRAVTASPPNPFTSRSISESLGRECDESFDAFASSRLNSPKSSPTNHPSNTTSWQAQVRSTPPHKGNTIPPIEEMRMSEEEAEPPPLPPRRPITRPLVNKRSSDSWLHRGQELAVQKEACLLSQTGAASLQHTREGGHKRCTPSPHLYPSLGKDLLVSSDMSDFHTEHSQHYANISPESPSPFKSEDDFKKFDYEPLRDEDDSCKCMFTEQDLWPDATENNLDPNVKDSIILLASEDTTDTSPTVREDAIVKTTSHSEIKALSLPVMLLDSEITVADLLYMSSPKHSKSSLKTLDIASITQDPTMELFSIHPDKPTKFRNIHHESPPLTLEDLNKNLSNSDFSFIDSASDASPSPSEMITVHTLKSLSGIFPQPPQVTHIASSAHDIRLSAEDMLTFQKPSTIDVNSALKANLPEASLCQDNWQDGGCELNTSGRDPASKKNNSIFTPNSLNINIESEDITRDTVDIKHTQSPLNRKGNIYKSKIDSSIVDPSCHIRTSPVSPQIGMQQEVVRNKQEVSQPLVKRTKPVNESSPRGASSHRSLKGMIRELYGNGGANSPGKGLRESPLHQSLSPGHVLTESIEVPFSYQPTKSNFSSPLSPDRETTFKAAKLFVSLQKTNTNSSTQSITKENCLTERSPSKQNGTISFEDLHAKVAPNVRSPMSARLRPGVSLHASSPSSVAPSLVTETNAQAKLLPTPGPSSIHHPPILRPSTGANATLAIAPCTSSSSSSSTSSTTVQPLVNARHTLLPEETQPTSSLPRQESRPHPVKPLTTTASQGEKKEGRSFLEKLKSSIHSGLAAKQTLAEAETEIEESLTDRSAQYEQLTKMELISLLLQQQMDMENQKAASEQQAVPLKKHEAEMKKIKAQVRDLEDYIDRLLVQIMEQTPTLLQVRSRHK